MTSAAIVTTLKGQGPSLKTFVNYHLSIGFEKIYLMFDDPLDVDIELVSDIQGVEAVAIDNAAREKWKSLKKFKQYEAHIDSEVRARQTLNAEMGLNMAKGDGIDYLLHIDSDELFWPRENTIHPHLQRLVKEEIISARYINFEAVPAQYDIEDYFLEVSAFKKSRALLAKQNIEVNDHWREKRKYFNFYNNGKSMCKVRDDMVPGDVHLWKSRESYIKTAKFYYPTILHYSCAGYQFFKTKYSLLLDNGYVASVFGKTDQKQKGFAVDYYATMAYRDGNEDKAKRIYENQVLMDQDKIDHYVDLRIMEQLDVPARIKNL